MYNTKYIEHSLTVEKVKAILCQLELNLSSKGKIIFLHIDGLCNILGLCKTEIGFGVP